MTDAKNQQSESGDLASSSSQKSQTDGQIRSTMNSRSQKAVVNQYVSGSKLQVGLNTGSRTFIN